MLWKKGIFSNLIWFVMTVVLFCGLLIFTDHVVDSVLIIQPGMEYLICSGILILVCLLVLLFRRFAVILGLDRFGEEHNTAILESILFLLMLIGGTVVRLLVCFDLNSESNSYFQVAILNEKGEGFTSVNGLVDLYHRFLRIVCFLFGNRIEACIFAQLVLCVLAGIVIAISVRKMAGGVAMLLSSALFFFSPYMIRATVVLSPGTLYIMMYFIALLMIAIAIKVGCRGWGYGLLAGLFTAFVIYLDIIGLSLLLVALSALYFERGENKPVLKGLFTTLEILGFTGAFLALLFLIDSYLSSIDFLYSVKFWLNNYMPGQLELPVIGVNFVPDDVEQIIFVFVLLGAIIGIYTYWISYKYERMSVWAMLFISVSAMYCMNITTEYFRGVPLIYLLLAALVSVGISGFARLQYTAPEVIEEAIESEPVEETVEPEAVEEAVEPEAVEMAAEPEPVEEAEAVSTFVPIPNPLPLPKKHKKRILDFDRQTSEDDDFDIDVSENDDFDV